LKKFILLAALNCFLFTACDTAKQVLEGVNTAYGNGSTGQLSNADIVSGLRQALTIGTQKSSDQLSNVDGFFKNAAIKILMPEEAKKAENTLRNLGMGNLADKAILSMNRAAEDAAKGAGAIFINSIKQMSITDAVDILKGGDFAATNYFKSKTTAELTRSFKPVIDKALENVNATKYWGDVTSAYNQFATKKVNTDLSAYVTQKAMDGIFYQVSLEEQKIRKNPVARTTEILKKVFGSKIAQGS
jgi:hypothetical protein